MSMRDVIEHALRAYYADSAEPNAIAREVLAKYDAETQRVRTERDRYRIAWRMAYQRAMGRGWAADRAGARARELQEALQHMLFAVIGSQLARKAATDEAGELRAQLADRPVNEALVKAREAAAGLFEAEVGERRPMWRVIYTDSESPSGVALVCTADGADDEHAVIADGSGGSMRDDEGVYDCCPWPQFETESQDVAAYLVELLNADSEAGEQS